MFGEYIHIYDMQQAREDGATVPIYYESRLAKLGLDAVELEALDEEVDELLEDEEEALREKHKSAWAAMEKIVGADPRLEAVARDIVEHFEEREKTQSGKAMIVAMNREICARLYEAIVTLRPDWHSDAVEEGGIKVIMTGSASDKPLLRKHLYSPVEKKRLERRFKDPADPLRVVIVRDMWLTGFDAPCLGTMYLDKPMKGHKKADSLSTISASAPNWKMPCANIPVVRDGESPPMTFRRPLLFFWQNWKRRASFCTVLITASILPLGTGCWQGPLTIFWV